jgi:hypothetical protein
MRHKTFDHSPRLTLNGFGEERQLRPVTLPKLLWLDAQPEIDDTAERIATTRLIRAVARAVVRYRRARRRKIARAAARARWAKVAEAA